MSNTGRIAVIGVIAVVAFGAAFLLTGDDEASDNGGTDVAVGEEDQTTTTVSDDGHDEEADPCLVDDTVPVEESPYQVSVSSEPDPPVPQDTVFEVLVERDGDPVEGATVCISADMTEMSHAGASAEGDDVGDGRYELDLNFGMRGRWSGSVVVIEAGQTPASMPLTFDVQ